MLHAAARWHEITLVIVIHFTRNMEDPLAPSIAVSNRIIFFSTLCCLGRRLEPTSGHTLPRLANLSLHISSKSIASGENRALLLELSRLCPARAVGLILSANQSFILRATRLISSPLKKEPRRSSKAVYRLCMYYRQIQYFTSPSLLYEMGPWRNFESFWDYYT